MKTLRDPFPTNTIKVKPQSVTQDQSKGLVTYYVDARIVAERLNEVVGSDQWSDEYRVISGPQEGTPVECRLTVNGVTKADVGQVKPGELDEKSWKSAYSDAFKRAAVKFGVGAYLYESPNVWAETRVGNNGKAQGFSENGRAHALAEYAKWIGDSGAIPSPAGAVGGTDGDQAAARVSPDGGLGAQAGPGSETGPAATSDGWIFPFGKHKGKPIADVPDDYLDWVLAQDGKFEDVKDRIAAHRLGAIGADPYVNADDDIPFMPTIDGLGN